MLGRGTRCSPGVSRSFQQLHGQAIYQLQGGCDSCRGVRSMWRECCKDTRRAHQATTMAVAVQQPGHGHAAIRRHEFHHSSLPSNGRPTSIPHGLYHSSYAPSSRSLLQPGDVRATIIRSSSCAVLRCYKDSARSSFQHGTSPSAAGQLRFSAYCAYAGSASSPTVSTLRPPLPTAFVSNHFQLGHNTVENYLTRKNLKWRIMGDKLAVMICPMCHDTKNDYTNMWKLAVWRSNGAYNCVRCGNSGSWFDLKANLGDLNLETLALSPPTYPSVEAAGGETATANSQDTPAIQLPPPSEALKYVRNMDEHPRAGEIKKWLTGKDNKERGLNQEVCDKYGVGMTEMSFKDCSEDFHKDELCVTLPWTEHDPNPTVGNLPYRVVRWKVRPLHFKAQQRLFPKGGGWGWFGWHTIPDDAKILIITEGEFDAMAVHQATGLPAISLPNGASSLPVQLLPALERFRTIYLFMDDDTAGQAGAEQFAKKLGMGRCLLVQSRRGAANGPKDANECLLQGVDMVHLLKQAQHLPHHQIQNFRDLRDEIFRSLTDPLGKVGTPYPSFPSLNSILKGHRRGELTILTGPTGIGKTTLLSHMTLELAMQGTVTLWGSFEIPNSRLARTMLSQHSGVDLDANTDKFDEFADRFQELPLYFLKFFGSSPLDQVLDAMDYAVYVKDVQHIVLDNLQFMLGGQGGRSFDKFDIQDQAISKFRTFATDNKVHITLVIHPRKEDDGSLLGVSSVFGSAKATQEADNVIIIQGAAPSPDDDPASRGIRLLEIKKNRFDGTCGAFPVRYQKDSRRYEEAPDLCTGNISIEQGEPNVWPSATMFNKHTRRGSGEGDSQSQAYSANQQRSPNFKLTRSFVRKPLMD
eukprot:gb/GEZN01001852.1/.p1 GENE.gb/GEZN01001852.1/~~gb/GEZN01001852.1/.p1  ORF type:complete len:864 (-),score=121.57 gb/GEZN01001852.1/:142-2733(-)